LGGVIYVLFIIVIAIILLAFLPCINFLFQLCFDTTTAVASIATRGAVRATNASAGGGKTSITRGIERGQRRLGRAADQTVNPAVQRRVDKVVRASQQADRRLRRGVEAAKVRARGGRRKVGVGTGAAVSSDDDTDFDLDERFLSPQQRRSLMLARRGYAGAPTGVIRGMANRMVDLSRRLVNFGVLPVASTGDSMEEKLVTSDTEEEEPTMRLDVAETETRGKRAESSSPVSSGHGEAYDQLARRLAAAVGGGTKTA